MSLSTNLVAYYKLDDISGNAADSIGSNTLINTGTATYSAGLINNGVDLALYANNKHLNVASNLGITGGPITISTWVKLNAEITTGTYFIAGCGDSSTNVNNLIWYEYNAGTIRVGFNRQKQNLSNNAVNINGALGTTNYHHLVYVYDGTNVYGYVDNVASSTLATSGNGASGVTSWAGLGWDGVNAATNHSSTKQDEFGIWNRALTAGEIATLYNGGAGLQYPFLSTLVPGGSFLFRMI
jgi:hypothetical protein